MSAVPTHPDGSRVRAAVAGVRVVFAAARSTFLVSVVLFGISSLGMVALLLIGNGLLHELIAQGSGGAWTAQLWFLVAAALVVGAVVSFAGSAATGMHRLLVERVIRYYDEVLLQVAASVRLSEFDSPEFHDRLQRAKTNSMAPMLLAMAVPRLLGGLIGVAGVAIGLATINPLLVAVTLVACVPLWLVGRRNSENMYSFSFGHTPNDRTRQNIERVINERRSAPEVRAFSLASFLLGRWSELYDERIREVSTLVRRFIRRSAVGSAVGALVLGAVFALVYVLVSNGSMPIGSAATASAAILLLANRGQQTTTSLAEITEQSLYIDDLLAFRARASTVQPVAEIACEPFDRLAADDVSFRYPAANADALDHVSFDIDAGEVIAIVGRNGSGKTTLAKLLCGLYEPTSGSIRWDGTPLTDLTEDGGLTQVGAVFQDFGRYWFSAADNIAIGDVTRTADRDGLVSAARAAGAAEFLEGLTAGYDTPLAVEVDGGVDLSGGQWQRVAIARVLFRDASFIVLDEPTASLDAEAESELFATIESLRAGRTIVIISHRFSTVRSADRILVLHDGELVEQGNHDDLMKLGGRYERMYSLQAESYVSATSDRRGPAFSGSTK